MSTETKKSPQKQDDEEKKQGETKQFMPPMLVLEGIPAEEVVVNHLTSDGARRKLELLLRDHCQDARFRVLQQLDRQPKGCELCLQLESKAATNTALMAEPSSDSKDRTVPAQQQCKLLDETELTTVLDKQQGCCESCRIPLTLFNKTAQKQAISFLRVVTWQPHRCKSLQTIRLYCQACALLKQVCLHDYATFQDQRRRLFASRRVNKLEAYYVDRLTPSNCPRVTKGPYGSKRELFALWARQQGLVTYRVPESLRLSVTRDHQRLVADGLLPDLTEMELEPLVFKSNFTKKSETESKAVADRDRDGSHDDLVQQQDYFAMADGDEKKKGGRGRKRKLHEMTGEEEAKSYNEKWSQGLASEDLLANHPGEYVTFYIPLDHRNYLLSWLNKMVPMAADPLQPLSPTNCLLTTKLLMSMENVFGLGQFLRYGLSVFRRAAVKFVEPVAKPAAILSDATSLSLKQVHALLLEEEQLALKLKTIRKQKVASFARLKPTLASFRHNETDLANLNTKFAIELKCSNSRNTLKPMDEDYLQSVLPGLLIQHGLLPETTTNLQDTAEGQACLSVLRDLVSKDMRGTKVSDSQLKVVLFKPKKRRVQT